MKKQEGFSILGLVIVIIVISLFSIVGYLVYQQDNLQQKHTIEPKSPTTTTITNTPGQQPANNPNMTPGFNFIFKYGVGAKNELDTFDATYTKDMVVDPSITITMSLTNDEMNSIYQKMQEIKFFDYPDKFSVATTSGEPISVVHPCQSYYFKVVDGSTTKELSWDDCIINKDDKADALRSLVTYIENIIESKKEYQALPTPRAMYQ